jgi:ATP-binding cassette subfamily F protein 3
MMEMDQLDAETAASAPQEVDDDQPKLSKKELKALQKKEEKMERQAAAKAEKKAARAAGDLEMPDEEPDEAPDEEPKVIVEDVPEEIAEPEAPEEIIPITLEDKIRKERPPPRIRVMESAQPGFVSLRLEKVGITFRNQEVLKDVTWGVQSGDRIGLVGRNGAGKTTQLRIMAGELEPTTGDLVKSSGTLRTAMLRQEFVDELVKERTLKEEFLSVFEEENKILQDLKDAEEALENMAGEDPDAMQQILDRMQELQQRAEDKDVYILESRVKKTMDLMGFNDEEGEDLVASFSGGWKMRIGLGKVLLKDPNVLLLGK